MMDIKQQMHEAFTVLGVQNRLNPMTTNYRALWEEQFAPRHETVQALAQGGRQITVFFPTGEPQRADILIGMMVPPDVSAPEGLVKREVPAGRFIVADCLLKDTGATWGYLFQNWATMTDAAIDFSKPTFEFYPPVAAGEEMTASIWIPILDN
jgi:predicted transcriptional regulator YdeE